MKAAGRISGWDCSWEGQQGPAFRAGEYEPVEMLLGDELDRLAGPLDRA